MATEPINRPLTANQVPARRASANRIPASRSTLWRRLYQYRKRFRGFRSEITAKEYFFSPSGQDDPQAELDAAITAYSSPARLYGIQQMPAACVFPARKVLLEKLLEWQFPQPPCPELSAWVERIGARQAKLVFVGAYPGNPASILGHSFIRLYDPRRESGRGGQDLLSYSVGFMAQANPGDHRLMYMLKGLTGGYDGYFEIEPHYMKVGLYNNSESRDLWEVTLKLSEPEVDLLVKHFWELTFNSRTPYYFLNKNCSLRLITLIEAVRADADISRRLSAVVLPAETIRAALAGGIAEAQIKYRPSVKKRIKAKLAALPADNRKLFDLARRSPEAILKVRDPALMDAVLDYWLYENYRAHGQMTPEKNALMDLATRQAAGLEPSSRHLSTNAQHITEPKPPYLGHKPRWVEFTAGRNREGASGGFGFRSGVHPYWSPDESYADIAAIEYLGGNFEFNQGGSSRWDLLLVKAYSLSDFLDWDRRLSWSFTAKSSNHCLLCATDSPQVHMAGGAGLALNSANVTFYALVHLQAAGWAHNGPNGLLAPGVVAGAKAQRRRWSVVVETSLHWWKALNELIGQARLSYALRENTAFMLDFRSEKLSGVLVDRSLVAGTALFY